MYNWLQFDMHRVQKSVSYFISSYGSMNPASHSYKTHFEDEFGVIQTKYILLGMCLVDMFKSIPLSWQEQVQKCHNNGIFKHALPKHSCVGGEDGLERITNDDGRATLLIPTVL